MAHITIEDIKTFRQETRYKLSDCKEALEKCNGDKEKAKKYILDKWSKKIEQF
jgi:translation elongation factor EF-Ts